MARNAYLVSGSNPAGSRRSSPQLGHSIASRLHSSSSAAEMASASSSRKSNDKWETPITRKLLAERKKRLKAKIPWTEFRQDQPAAVPAPSQEEIDRGRQRRALLATPGADTAQMIEQARRDYIDKIIVPGIEVFDTFQNRTEMRALGVHQIHQAGIATFGHGSRSLATSVVISDGSRYQNEDGRETIIYCGSGGDEEVKQSGENNRPVRVLRNHHRHGGQGSEYVYYGLYNVVAFAENSLRMRRVQVQVGASRSLRDDHPTCT